MSANRTTIGIALPNGLAARVAKIPKGERSKLIAAALEQWLPAARRPLRRVRLLDHAAEERDRELLANLAATRRRAA